MKSFLIIGIMLLSTLVGRAQDSISVKKPTQRMQENMPTRRGRGTAKPMPSPRYYRQRPAPPKDTVIKGFNKRDTVR
ncbi:hypothetical protein J2I47_21065 [Fibrella sp. HMF5335]|uniref:Uncharacterized protein n=1 Tax=Fibrella rubiginis TaxID=2817060 RepID=A0A939GJQ0_9BACT|nr:hypothetical protein [Fibrella rubiginis]MBO0939058.1 hypothetical protein [Fibrella rubiginis]